MDICQYEKKSTKCLKDLSKGMAKALISVEDHETISCIFSFLNLGDKSWQAKEASVRMFLTLAGVLAKQSAEQCFLFLVCVRITVKSQKFRVRATYNEEFQAKVSSLLDIINSTNQDYSVENSASNLDNTFTLADLNELEIFVLNYFQFKLSFSLCSQYLEEIQNVYSGCDNSKHNLKPLLNKYLLAPIFQEKLNLLLTTCLELFQIAKDGGKYLAVCIWFITVCSCCNKVIKQVTESVLNSIYYTDEFNIEVLKTFYNDMLVIISLSPTLSHQFIIINEKDNFQQLVAILQKQKTERKHAKAMPPLKVGSSHPIATEIEFN